MRKSAIIPAAALAALVIGAAPANAGETDPGWNCLTMGNRVCGPQYQPLPADYRGLLVNGFDIPRHVARHALVTYITGADDTEAEGEVIARVVTPGWRDHPRGRVLYF